MYIRLLLAAALLLPGYAICQQILNKDFELLCPETKSALCHWDIAWGSPEHCGPDSLNGYRCLKISGQQENAVGFVEQTLLLETTDDLRVIEVHARLKTKSVRGKGAGLNIGMYDADGTLVATKDMGGYYSVDWTTGTNGWSKVSVTTVCPAGAVSVKIGAILYGQGEAWFDDYEISIATVVDREPSPLARRLIGSACDTIARHALVRDSLAMDALCARAMQVAGNAQSFTACYPAIQYLVESLRPAGDHHSFFMTAREVESWEGSDTRTEGDEVELPQCTIRQDCGYLRVPGFHSGNADHITLFAETLQRGICDLATSRVRGWIVDLRDNTGGNMQPMIAGLGPLLDRGPLGSLVDVNGQHESWSYDDGTYYWESEALTTLAKPCTLQHRLPIAVLTNARTGSSGEIVVISFIGNSNTRSFGQPTWGLTSGNGSFDLMDGSRLMLSSTIMCDRNRQPYTGPISPDVILDANAHDEIDKVLEAAVQWIMRQD